MKDTYNPQRVDQILDVIGVLGFIHRNGCWFYHPMFGIDFLFDLSACSLESKHITTLIFNRIVEYGEDKKLAEIKNVFKMY